MVEDEAGLHFLFFWITDFIKFQEHLTLRRLKGSLITEMHASRAGHESLSAVSSRSATETLAAAVDL